MIGVYWMPTAAMSPAGPRLRERVMHGLSYTCRIWVLDPKQTPTQSGWLLHHCSWLISSPAEYARIGSNEVSTQFVPITACPMDDRSQMRACKGAEIECN